MGNWNFCLKGGMGRVEKTCRFEDVFLLTYQNEKKNFCVKFLQGFA